MRYNASNVLRGQLTSHLSREERRLRLSLSLSFSTLSFASDAVSRYTCVPMQVCVLCVCLSLQSLYGKGRHHSGLKKVQTLIIPH